MEYKIIIAPIYYKRSVLHWTFVIIRPQKHKFEFWDLLEDGENGRWRDVKGVIEVFMIKGREQTLLTKMKMGRKEGKGNERIVCAGMKTKGNMVDSEMVMMDNRPHSLTFHSEVRVLSIEGFDHKGKSQQMRVSHFIDSPIGIQVPCVQQSDGVFCGLFVAWFAYNYISNIMDAVRIP